MFDQLVFPGPLEAAAIIVTVASVFLAVKRNIWQYPVGILGVILFAKVFVDFSLYSSAVLQVFFLAVLIYGWWYWLKGDNGKPPLITHVSKRMALGVAFAIGAFALLAGLGVKAFGGALPFWDSLILSASLGAQFLLDRKKIETWIAWALVNVVSVPVYYSQGMHFTSLLYLGLLFNTGIGYYYWRREMYGYREPHVSNHGTDDGYVTEY